MGDLLLPYLIAMAATLVAIIVAAGAFVASHVRSVSCQKREARLPLATRWSDLSHRVADLEAERTELQEALNEARQLIDEGERMRDYIDRTRLEVEQLEEQHRQLQEVETRLTQVQEQLAAENEKLDAIASELRAAEFGRDEANRKREELERRIEELKSSIDAMNATHGEIQQGIDDRRAELAEVKGELESVRARIEPAKAELERLGEEIAERRKRIDDLESRRDKLEQEIESIREQRGAVAAEVEALEARGSGLEARAQQLENQVGDLRSELRADPRSRPFEDQIVDLTHGVLRGALFDTSVADDCSEEQQLNEVRQVLGDRGYRFSRRVIDAFHTSLKVSSETPLLVLAGISGTGKSLLPRLYAETMGMHFLMMPVQPRWDGPQDLLGFYNHLENRFQPTELTRALIQMDRFAQEHLRQSGVDPLHERMLLVLLDEMNLARVEYYFSDFLSRLEARRDIGDIENAERRQIAEVIIETGGASSDDYDDVRLFVDSNVLFAGTMNEDESTLALSDKVIDRANVMRFGRPRQLHASRSSGTVNAVHSPSTAFLPRSVWDNWIRESDACGLPDEEVEGWINRMNEALGGIGRPFGYRTANAIRAYIRRYPLRSNDGYRYAMSDQIEQRVLPKLRGAEPDDPATGDCIRQVHGLAQELGDAPLTAAIDRARQGHGGHLFVWSGTERSGEE